ncbi:recombinase family protein [Corallococcus terminator]|uniref:Recombinase family protein n=2 Tax=Corallococcus terminator TaxID=2316733 RepID=A0A3A8HYS8_9BACT|nr:recombinase family protein [Corallococcus terminator]
MVYLVPLTVDKLDQPTEVRLELDRLGVKVIFLQEGWLDTTVPVRSLLVAVFGWVAEQERHRLIERTKAGLDRARAQGKRLGRPLASPVRTVVWATAPGSLGPTGC